MAPLLRSTVHFWIYGLRVCFQTLKLKITLKLKTIILSSSLLYLHIIFDLKSLSSGSKHVFLQKLFFQVPQINSTHIITKTTNAQTCFIIIGKKTSTRAFKLSFSLLEKRLFYHRYSGGNRSALELLCCQSDTIRMKRSVCLAISMLLIA